MIEPVAWASEKGAICTCESLKKVMGAAEVFTTPLYAIPAGYALVPVSLLEEIIQSLEGTPMSMRSRGDARIAKDVAALIAAAKGE